MSLKFLNISFPDLSLWFLGGHGGCVVHEKKFWGPARCGLWRFPVKCVPRYLVLILRNGDGLGEGLRRSTGRRKVGSSTGSVQSPGMRPMSKERPQQAVGTELGIGYGREKAE